MQSENYAPLMEMIISPFVTYLDFFSKGRERTEGRGECSVQSSCNILVNNYGLSHNFHQRALASTQGNKGRATPKRVSLSPIILTVVCSLVLCRHMLSSHKRSAHLQNKPRLSVTRDIIRGQRLHNIRVRRNLGGCSVHIPDSTSATEC